MKRIINILLVGATCYVMSGCKKSYLDLNPYDQVPTNLAIVTENDVQAAVNGIYNAMRSSSLYGRDIPVRGDLLADNTYVSSVNSGRELDIFQVNYSASTGSTGGTWTAYYTAILNANNVVNSSPVVNTNTNQYKGEALALRGLLYFDLVKQYAKQYTAASASTDLGVPLILAYDPSVKPKRSTVQQVYDQIEKDLLAAVPLLTDRSPYSAAYMNKNTAKSLLARLYLFKGDWAKALSNAQDVINSGGYTLTGTANYQSYWSNTSARTDKLESLFELNFDPNSSIGFNSLPYIFLQTGYGDILVADAFYNTYSATDIRRSVILSATRGGKSVKVINKFSDNNNFNIKMVRLSDVYLMAAEASYQTGNTVQALSYLNQVATRRDPAFLGYTSTGAQILEDILTERRKELAFEGFRYWDLQRYGRDVVRVNLNSNYQGNVPLTIAATNFRRIFPIPQAELDANPNIRTQQNPGY